MSDTIQFQLWFKTMFQAFHRWLNSLEIFMIFGPPLIHIETFQFHHFSLKSRRQAPQQGPQRVRILCSQKRNSISKKVELNCPFRSLTRGWTDLIISEVHFFFFLQDFPVPDRTEDLGVDKYIFFSDMTRWVLTRCPKRLQILLWGLHRWFTSRWFTLR